LHLGRLGRFVADSLLEGAGFEPSVRRPTGSSEHLGARDATHAASTEAPDGRVALATLGGLAEW